MDKRAEVKPEFVRIALALHHWDGALEASEAALGSAGLSSAYRQLCLGRDEIRDSLKSAGLEIERPMGRSFADVADCVEVRGWREQSALTSEQVIQVLEPIIRQGAELLRPGQVIMGRPLAPPATVLPVDQAASVLPDCRTETDGVVPPVTNPKCTT